MNKAIRESEAMTEYLMILKNGLIALGVTMKELQTKPHGVWDLY